MTENSLPRFVAYLHYNFEGSMKYNKKNQLVAYADTLDRVKAQADAAIVSNLEFALTLDIYERRDSHYFSAYFKRIEDINTGRKNPNASYIKLDKWSVFSLTEQKVARDLKQLKK